MITASPRFNSRAELRLALLAAGESCWLYALVLSLGALASFPRVISPLGIFIVYMAGFLAGRVLPRLPQSWRVLQILVVGIAFLAILVAMRVGLYTDSNLADFSWLSAYLTRVLSFFQRFSAEALSTLVLIFTFIRALQFAQRPLTLWVVGFQFRLGIVIFFGLTILAALATRVNLTLWIFMYFAFFLVSIALARIEDAGRLDALGARWAGIMLTMLAVTLLVGYALTQFLTLRVVNSFFAFLSPLAFVFQVILLLIAIPFIYLADFLFRLLLPLFQRLGDLFARLFPAPIESNPEALRVLEAVGQQLENLAPYLRLVGVLLVVLWLGWLIARALNKRMKLEEEEMFARETLNEKDSKQFESSRRARTPRVTHREIHAENIRRIYAALQAQADALGLKRRDAETPHEFLPRLTARFPALGAELQTITNAYVAVHYAQQPVTENQVRELRGMWTRTRAQMKADNRRQTTDRK